MEAGDGTTGDQERHGEDRTAQLNTSDDCGGGEDATDAGAEEDVSSRLILSAPFLDSAPSLHHPPDDGGDEDGGNVGGEEGASSASSVGLNAGGEEGTEDEEAEERQGTVVSGALAVPSAAAGAGRGAPRGRGGQGKRRGKQDSWSRASNEVPYWKGDAGKAFPKPEPKRRPYPFWPSWDSLVQKLYVLDWEDSAEWYVPMKSGKAQDREAWSMDLLRDPLEHEAKLDRVKERRKSLKSLVRYNLVQGRVARAIPAKSRTYHFSSRVKKPIDDADVDYMGMLPFEVIYLIMSFLDPVIDLPVASCVCKLWNLIASDPLFWIPAMRRRDIMGNTVLHLAASSIDEEQALRTCAYFIQRGALVDVHNRYGATPVTIATALDHQVLHLYLLRHSTKHGNVARQYMISCCDYCVHGHWGIPFDAYMRVAERIHSELLRLHPLPTPPTIEMRQRDALWSGLPMHRLLPKLAFAFLQPTGEPYDRHDHTLARWRSGLGRNRPSPATESAEETRSPQSQKKRHTTLDPRFWAQDSTASSASHVRRGGRRRRGLPSDTPPRAPRPAPNWDDRRSFPALPRSRGRGAKIRGRGRGSASASARPIEPRAARHDTGHQRSQMQAQAELGSSTVSSRGSGTDGRISRQDKGKEKVVE